MHSLVSTPDGIPRISHAHIRSPGKTRTAGRSARRSGFAAASRPANSPRKSRQSKLPREKARSKFDKDEHNRPDTTLESLSKLKPAFRKDGTITAGNAPGLNTGAAAMVVADRAWAEKKGLQPMARLVAYGIGAVEPGMFGLGPVPAVKQALDRAGWKIGDIERIEINEAFAAIALAVTKDLGLSRGCRQCGRRRHRAWSPDRRDAARCSRHVCCIRCSATGSKKGSSRCASAADRELRWHWKP